MKTISVAVSESDYRAFQQAAKHRNRSTAELIREAMVFFREEKLEARGVLETFPALPGHRALGDLPNRAEIYDEILNREPGS